MSLLGENKKAKSPKNHHDRFPYMSLDYPRPEKKGIEFTKENTKVDFTKLGFLWS